MEEQTRLNIEENIVKMLKTVFDPEIPVDVYNLGLIYNIDVQDSGHVRIDMTLTAPSCPASEFLMEDIRMKVESVEGVKSLDVQLVFEPEWDKDMMSDEAKLELGFLLHHICSNEQACLFLVRFPFRRQIFFKP